MRIDPKRVHEALSRHQMADGLPVVFDLERSHGAYLVDARTGDEYLDFFTCFASWPVGYRHPMLETPEFLEELTAVAATNPTNSDLYTTHMAEFVEAFSTRVTPPEYLHHFWVSGGALAVENALKTAFDWKANKIGVEKSDDGNALSVLHFREAFHGRSGYTMSLTNTDRAKIDLFPKFAWPRVHNPKLAFDLDGKPLAGIEESEARAVAEIEAAFERHRNRIACIIIEPMQAEGGDNHFRSEFLARLRRIADENEALLVFDEVQTGFYSTGKPWMWQLHGVKPDVVAFGKKTQVCGIYANARVDEVEQNVFRRASRINSTWGGSLVDMVRSRRFIEIIETEGLAQNVARRGAELVQGLRQLARERGGFDNVRGVGSLVAFDLETPAARNALLKELRAKKLLALACGTRSLRFRLPFVLGEREVKLGIERLAACLRARVRA